MGSGPINLSGQFSDRRYTYGYIGTDDFTMYPILPPGTFVQIDESKARVVDGAWRSEYERPVYFVETRDGYTCCWCTCSKRDWCCSRIHCPRSRCAF